MTTDHCPAQPSVLFAGALPPPVTGMTVMTDAIVKELRRRGAVQELNWSQGRSLPRWQWKLARLFGAARTLLALAGKGKCAGRTFYYPVSSAAGLYYDWAIAQLARVRGYRVVLHHHAYSYIDRHDWRAKRLLSLADAHVVHCPMMRDDILQIYPTQVPFYFVPPTIALHCRAASPPSGGRSMTLGFLSELSNAKGLDDVLATFRRLIEAGDDVRLILAGPYRNAAARQAVESALLAWPDRVESRGRVYEDEKARFYAEIDAFLFPTRSESWGLVLNEALNVGRPVIARSRGCVSWIVREGCGLLVEPQADFVAAAVEQLQAWIKHPEQWRQASEAARRRSAALIAEAQQQFPAFIDQLLGAEEVGSPQDP